MDIDYQDRTFIFSPVEEEDVDGNTFVVQRDKIISFQNCNIEELLSVLTLTQKNEIVTEFVYELKKKLDNR